MKAVGYRTPSPIDAPDALLDLTLPDPTPGPRDLLVEVRAVSVNPVDTKVRNTGKPAPLGDVQVLGYDAAGIVCAIGPGVTLFHPGDEVFYAGSILRPGTNAELHLVDERLVALKPRSLSFAQAAALPLTALTAMELLFDRLAVPRSVSSTALQPAATSPTPQHLLIVGGAGGVGSVLIQIARQLTTLTVIATASRPETQQWCRDLGAHHVISHADPLRPQLEALGIPAVELVAALTNTDQHFPALADLLAPTGKVGVIDDPKDLNVKLLKRKSASLHWEFMFTRSSFQTPDMIEQHRILSEIATLVDRGTLRSTTGAGPLGPINAANLREAHRLIESGRAQGKTVLEGF